MGFSEAVQTCLSKYATFSGRARRSEYWFFYLAVIVAYIAALIIDAVIGTTLFVPIVFLGVIVPTLAAGVRRLHDTGKSGWFILIGLIPLVGGIIVLVFFVMDSAPGDNQYGPNPKNVGGGFGDPSSPYGQPGYGG